MYFITGRLPRDSWFCERHRTHFVTFFCIKKLGLEIFPRTGAKFYHQPVAERWSLCRQLTTSRRARLRNSEDHFWHKDVFSFPISDHPWLFNIFYFCQKDFELIFMNWCGCFWRWVVTLWLSTHKKVSSNRTTIVFWKKFTQDLRHLITISKHFKLDSVWNKQALAYHIFWISVKFPRKIAQCLQLLIRTLWIINILCTKRIVDIAVQSPAPLPVQIRSHNNKCTITEDPTWTTAVIKIKDDSVEDILTAAVPKAAERQVRKKIYQ